MQGLGWFRPYRVSAFWVWECRGFGFVEPRVLGFCVRVEHRITHGMAFMGETDEEAKKDGKKESEDLNIGALLIITYTIFLGGFLNITRV